VLCHRALLIGYTREERQIDRSIMLQAAKELDRKELVRENAVSHRISVALQTGALVLLGTVALIFVSTHGWLAIQTPQKADDPHLAQPQAAEISKDAVPPPTTPLPSESASRTTPSSSVEKPQVEQQAGANPPALATSTTTLAEQPATPSSQPTAISTRQRHRPLPQESSDAQAFKNSTALGRERRASHE
jgi:hypothetical protein